MDVAPRTKHQQGASVGRHTEDRNNTTSYGRSALERSFRTQTRDSRAISALDAKLNIMQNLIYGASGPKRITGRKK